MTYVWFTALGGSDESGRARYLVGWQVTIRPQDGTLYKRLYTELRRP